MEDCYIRVSQIVKIKSGVILTFIWKEQKEIYYVKAKIMIDVHKKILVIQKVQPRQKLLGKLEIASTNANINVTQYFETSGIA